jgi:predicted enzyme related to lactoylglutathione lyase
LAFFGGSIAEPKANKSVILEFRVADVDKEYARAREFISEVVQEPTTMPWGNRSLLFRDPDGNLINLFTPVSAEAIRKFGAF